MKPLNHHRRLVYLALCFFLSPLTHAADHKHGSMPVGYHEFVIFGLDKTYLSHYPMFSSIHAFQVIAEVTLDNDGEKAYRDHLTKNPKTHLTFSPYRKSKPGADRRKDQDDWVLPDTIAQDQKINGDIHYRKDGKTITVAHNVELQVKQVIEKRELNPKDEQPKTDRYWFFGSKNEAFLARILFAPANPGEQKVDTDLIVSVKPLGKAWSVPKVRSNVAIVARHKGRGLLAVGDTALIKGDDEAFEIEVTGLVHEEQVSTQR